MIEIGNRAKHLKYIGQSTLKTKKAERGWFSDVTILDISECGKYVKLRGKISWGGYHSFWCERKSLNEDLFKKVENK